MEGREFFAELVVAGLGLLEVVVFDFGPAPAIDPASGEGVIAFVIIQLHEGLVEESEFLLEVGEVGAGEELGFDLGEFVGEFV